MDRAAGWPALTGAFDESLGARHGSGPHRLALALLVSVVLHALLVAALPGLRTSVERRTVTAPRLAAYLVPASEPPAAEPRSAATPARSQPLVGSHGAQAKRAPSSSRTRIAERRIVVAPTAELPRQRSVEPPATPSELNGVTVQSPSHALAAPSGAEDASAHPTPRAGEADSASALDQYRRALIAEALRYRRYPRAALDNDWRGKVEVRLVVGSNGALDSLAVDHGSGHAVLDRQALEMIRRARLLAPIPAALRGRAFTLDIPVIFELREPNA